jgi:small subunit ribosomal protein S1
MSAAKKTTRKISLRRSKRKKASQEMEKLLASKEARAIPKVGDLVEGEIISLGKNEIHLDIGGLTTGVIRGYELSGNSREYSIGDKISAVILDLENENGEMELSLRRADQEKTWKELERLMKEKETITVKVTEANKGGLMVRFGQILGFLPSSQLSSQHYPKVADGAESKILEKLRKLVGKNLEVKIIDILEDEGKIVVSEKEAVREIQKKAAAKYKLGDKIEGEVVDLTPFGAFVRFGENLEGLVHISEIAWQKVDHPEDFLKIGQKVKAEIIGLDGPKIFLSIKKLTRDPWEKAAEKYKVGQKVKGRISRITPYGFFVELEKDLLGLAHLSELSSEPVDDPQKIAKVGDVLEFKIITIEPEDHRMGLSIRALKEE